jgi:thioredoxin reductase (NADPH)
MTQATDEAVLTGNAVPSPVLDDRQLETLTKYGVEENFRAGDLLFGAGDAARDLIVLLDGKVRAVENHAQPGERVIVIFGPHQFIGEMRLLTGQRAFVSAIAETDGRMLRISAERFRSLMAEESELSELMLRTFLLRHASLTHIGAGLILVGSRFDADTRRLLEILARNRLPSRWLDLERSGEAEHVMRSLNVPVKELPILVVPGGPVLRNPNGTALMEALGIAHHSEDGNRAVDLLVVGGGPGGLAAAVYGASEGMTTVLAEATALGGQAGTSSRIENYLGFPAGLSGEELAARAALQAEKFGVTNRFSGAGSLAIVGRRRSSRWIRRRRRDRRKGADRAG